MRVKYAVCGPVGELKVPENHPDPSGLNEVGTHLRNI